ncbi:hypothetical protein BC628DRAFT_1414996 [Trametes gibbosa]|nr:hypothetical protein BC628DRAFT_1414996 [Trametes gibbosa]
MAASAADVRSILSLPNAPASTSTPQQKKPGAAERARKPDGIPRELYALIGPSAPTLAAQFAKPRLKQKPNLGGGGRVKWEWQPFKNQARSDGLQLSHWTKAGTEPDADYPFAKYNVQSPDYVYSQDEYSRLLEDQDWTKEETDYLFELVREYDGRFYIVHDRYEYSRPDKSARSLEDIKDRYFSVCRKLVRNRPWAGDEASRGALLSSLSFDKGREFTRKKYVKSLEDRTPEQIAEEDALYLELEKLKENERRFKKDRDELLRTLLGIESGLPDIPIDEEGLQGSSTETKKKRKGVAGSVEPQTPITPTAPNVISLSQPQPKKTSAKSAAYDTLHCIVRTDAAQTTKAPHVPAHLRSTKIPPVKPASASVRVAQVLNEIGLSATRLVMPTAENIARFEPVLINANQVVDMKKTLDKVEQDIAIAKERLAVLRGETTEGGTDGTPQTPMAVDDGADADSVVDGRAQSVMSTKSTKSARSRRQTRRSMSISSVDTSGGPNKRQKR